MHWPLILFYFPFPCPPFAFSLGVPCVDDLLSKLDSLFHAGGWNIVLIACSISQATQILVLHLLTVFIVVGKYLNYDIYLLLFAL